MPATAVVAVAALSLGAYTGYAHKPPPAPQAQLQGHGNAGPGHDHGRLDGRLQTFYPPPPVPVGDQLHSLTHAAAGRARPLHGAPHFQVAIDAYGPNPGLDPARRLSPDAARPARQARQADDAHFDRRRLHAGGRHGAHRYPAVLDRRQRHRSAPAGSAGGDRPFRSATPTRCRSSSRA